MGQPVLASAHAASSAPHPKRQPPTAATNTRTGIPGSRHIYLGLYSQERDAARAYDTAQVRSLAPPRFLVAGERTAGSKQDKKRCSDNDDYKQA